MAPMNRARVYRTDPNEWCAELRVGSLTSWRFATTWRRAMSFARVGLERGSFPDDPMAGERWPQQRKGAR